MFNILISKTDPYSFMGLLKATDTKGTLGSSIQSLKNAGLISIMLVAMISYMAPGNLEAAQANSLKGTTLEIGSNTTQAAPCSLKTCHMV